MEYHNKDYKDSDNINESFDTEQEFPVKLERVLPSGTFSSITLHVKALNDTAAVFAALEKMPGWTAV